MYHLARNVLKDHYKMDSRNGNHVDITGYDEKMDNGLRADRLIEQKQELQLLQNALQNLNPDLSLWSAARTPGNPRW